MITTSRQTVATDILHNRSAYVRPQRMIKDIAQSDIDLSVESPETLTTCTDANSFTSLPHPLSATFPALLPTLAIE